VLVHEPDEESLNELYVGAHLPPAATRLRGRVVKDKKLLTEDFEALRKRKCCHNCCLEQFTVIQLKNARQTNVNCGTEDAVLRWAIGLLSENVVDGHMQYVFHQKVVCHKAWRLAHGLSEYKLYKAVHYAEEGCMEPVRQPRSYPKPVRDWVHRKLEQVLRTECDTLAGGHMVLPDFLINSVIWAEVIEGWNKGEMEPPKEHKPPSSGLIRDVLANEFKDVHRPKKGEWSLCGVCAELTAKLHVPGVDQADKEAIHKDLRRHRRAARIEREAMKRLTGEVEQPGSGKIMGVLDCTHPAFLATKQPANKVCI
jgi:hypothetical protein